VTGALSYYTADLHLHTVLSPCAELEMLPPLIIKQAVRLGLRLLAVTDHNSAENAAAMIAAGAREGIDVLPGMELQTREEVHLICLFDTLEQVLTWQERVYRHLPDLANREEVFGSQLIVDAEGEFVAFQERLLLTSTTFSVEGAVQEVGDLGGMVIPAHVDRPAYSLLSNLGFIPPALAVPALELSTRTTPAEARRRFPQARDWPFICDGDAHRLSEMQNRTLFKIERPTIAELRLAFAGEDGRKVLPE
jgi:3',5'-nucleoside bisphosphate phosphatase